MRLQILDPKAVRRKLPRAYNHDCMDAACLDALRQEIGANHLLQVNVFYTRAGHSIGVTWVDREAIAYGETAKLEEETPDSAREAAMNAMVPSHAQQQRGPGPWLAVDGKPTGPPVRVNGTSMGTIPYYGRAQPGPNRVVVSKNGFETREQVVEIPGNPEAFTQVQIDLTPVAKPIKRVDKSPPSPLVTQQQEPRAPDRTSAWNYVVGGVLAAGVVTLLAYGLVSSDADGECVRATELNRCIQTGDTQPRAIAAFVGAGVAAVGSATFFIVQPFVDASPDERRAGLRVKFVY